MTLSLKDLLKIKPDITINTSIGNLCLFSISVKDQSELINNLNMDIKEVVPKEFLEKLIPFICFPEDQLKDGLYKPDKPVITPVIVDDLYDEDLENIAKNYVLNNEYLFKKSEIKIRKDADGKDVHYSVYTDIEHPQQTEESFICYLHRLSCLEHNKQKERMSSILGSMPRLDIFSKALSGGIVKNLMFGDSITKPINPAKTTQDFELAPIRSSFEPQDWAKDIDSIRREPFDDLAQRLDVLISSSAKASEFMVDANRIQTEIAAEIKAGGDTTDQHAKKNIKLTYVVILLTICGLLVSGLSAYSGLSFSKATEDKIDSYADNLIGSIALSSKELIDNRIESKSIQSEVLSELKKINESIKSNQNIMNNIYREMEQLKSSNKEHENKIKELNNQLQAIKKIKS